MLLNRSWDIEKKYTEIVIELSIEKINITLRFEYFNFFFSRKIVIGDN